MPFNALRDFILPDEVSHSARVAFIDLYTRVFKILYDSGLMILFGGRELINSTDWVPYDGSQILLDSDVSS